jgi:hypothetical protein
MSESNIELIRLLVEQVKQNSSKLDDMKEAYYELKNAVDSHQDMDEKMHKDVCEFMESTNKKLDEYNRQLEIHIAGTIENRKDIAEFKATLKPLIDDFVEDTIIKRARNKAIVKWTKVAGFVGTLAGATAGILKLLDLI